MKRYSSILLMLFSALVFSQEVEPDFIEEIHKRVPNIVKADSMFLRYKERKEGKPLGYYTVYEKEKGFIDYWHSEFHHWRKENLQYVTANGDIVIPTPKEIVEEFNKEQQQRQQKRKTSYRNTEQVSPKDLKTSSPLWTYLGPKKQYTIAGKDLNTHTNVQAFDQSLLNRDLLYSAPESGGVYKSIDRGVTWSVANQNHMLSTCQFLKIHPEDDNKVIAATTSGTIYSTIDGGTNWRSVALPSNLAGVAGHAVYDISTIEIIPSDGTDVAKVFLLGRKGLYTYDFDTNTVSAYSDFNIRGSEIKKSPSNSNTIYLLGLDETTLIEYLYVSTDRGITWVKKEGTGYLTLPDGQEKLVNIRGGRIGLTPADPNRIYVYLIGEYKSGEPGGYITFMRSENGGDTWTITDSNGPGQGGVAYEKNNFTTAKVHVNLSAAGNGSYHQGYYNTGILVDQFDADKVIVGGVTYHKTINGGNSWSMVSNGYIPTSERSFHSDFQFGLSNQFGTEQDNWICNDGGVLYSNNFFENIGTEAVTTRSGNLPTQFWGFDVGLFHKNLTGGRYHNGDAAMASSYNGNFVYVGGAETDTGLVLFNNEEREMMWRDTTDRVIPSTLGGNDGYAVSNAPYYPGGHLGSKTTPMFDKTLSGTYYFGIKNKIIKFAQDKKGIELNEFQHELICVATCATNENYIYTVMQGKAGYSSYDRDAIHLYRSTDGGLNWTKVHQFPNTSKDWRGYNIFVDNNNPLRVWAYSKLSNDFRVSEDGGETFNTLAQTPTGAYSMVYQWSSNNIYAAGRGVAYRYDIENNTWHDFLDGLPAGLTPHRIQATYGEKKVILSSNGYGVWEADFYSDSDEEPVYAYLNSDVIIGFDKTDLFNLQAGIYGDISSKTISWETTSSKATITVAADKNSAQVVFNDFGIFDVIYKLTDSTTGTVQTIVKKFYIYPGCSFDEDENQILIPMDNILTWFDASDATKEGSTFYVKEKRSGKKFSLRRECSYSTIDDFVKSDYNASSFNSLYFNGRNYCYLPFDKEYDGGKTFFWVFNQNEGTLGSQWRFILGGRSVADFSNYYSNGDRTKILNTTTELKFDYSTLNSSTIVPSATNKPTQPGVLALRVKEGEQVLYNSFTRDRTNYRTMWLGHLAELIIYERRLSDEEIKKVEQYLMKKYHITTP